MKSDWSFVQWWDIITGKAKRLVNEREAIVNWLSTLTSPHGTKEPYGCEAVLLKSHCSCHNGLPRKAVLIPESLHWTSVCLLQTATENLRAGFHWILWDSLQKARALVCVTCCLITTLSDMHPRAEDHCEPGPSAVRETSLCCAFTFEWATCGWGICLLKAGTKPLESVSSWANASGWEVQSVIFALGPVSSAQSLHRSKAPCLIMVTKPHTFMRTVCLLTSPWCARPGLYSCFCYGITLT